MTKVTMPEPIGYFACNPETLEPMWDEDCVCQDNIYNQDDMGAVGRAIIFADQAEAYAAAKVREASEEAAGIADREHFGGERDDDLSWTDCAAHIASAIRALIPN